MLKDENTDRRRQSGFCTIGIQSDIQENESNYDPYAEYTLDVNSCFRSENGQKPK